MDVFLDDGAKAGLGDGEGIAARSKIQELKMAIAIGGFSADKIGVEIFCFNGGIRYAAAFFVEDIALDATGGELRLAKS